MKRWLIAGLVMVLGVSFVGNASAAGGPRDGIARAKAVDIKIGPHVEGFMARAPLGSCLNDPTQAKCSKIHAVVRRGTQGLRHYAQIPQCGVKLGDSPSSPYKAAGYAQADGKNYCSPRVTWQQLYVSLSKYYKKKWFIMNAKATPKKPGGITLRLSTRYKCTGSPLRAWHAQAVGYDVMDGVLYLGIESQYHNLRCG